MSPKLFLWHLLLLMVGFSSCKTYQNIENIKMPKNKIVKSDTFPPSYFAQIIPGVKIQITDKDGQVNELIFSRSDETNVYGQIFIGPVQSKKVDDFTIPIANIKNVRGVNVPSKNPAEIEKGKGLTEDDFKKILAGEQIKVYTSKGQQLIMVYREVNEGSLHGELMVSPDTQMEITPTAFVIPLSEVEKVTVLRNSAGRVVGYGLYLLAGIVVGFGLFLLLLVSAN